MKVKLNDIIFGAALTFFGITLGAFLENRKWIKTSDTIIKEIREDINKNPKEK